MERENIHCVRQAGAGMVWEKNTVGLAGAGAGDWSGVRGKYCWAGAGAGCRMQWYSAKQLSIQVDKRGKVKNDRHHSASWKY